MNARYTYLVIVIEMGTSFAVWKSPYKTALSRVNIIIGNQQSKRVFALVLDAKDKKRRSRCASTGMSCALCNAVIRKSMEM